MFERPWRAWCLGAVLAAAALPQAGCDGVDAAAECPEERLVNGVCAGVPDEGVCDTDVCTEGAPCEVTVVVEQPSDLEPAAATATAGTCLALGPGDYPAVAVAGGVHVLGKGAASVTIEGLQVGAGAGSVVRGLTIGSGGLAFDGTTGAKVEAVRVAGSTGTGIAVKNGASATVIASTIEGAGGYGIDGRGASGLDVEKVIVSGAGLAGVWAECEAGCACDEKPAVVLSGVIVEGATLVGVALSGAQAVLSSVRITETQQFMLDGGGGLSIAACSQVSATGLEVSDNAGFGILVAESGGTIGATGEGNGVTVQRNLRGIWAEDAGAGDVPALHIENATVADNRGVGIGFGGDTVGFIICKTAITGTKKQVVLVGFNEVDEVGDGLVWTAGAQAAIEQVTLDGNERASLLIDGEVGTGSLLKDITQGSGDASKGIVHQHLPAGGVEPQSIGAVPSITKVTDGMFSVPTPPAIPAAQ